MSDPYIESAVSDNETPKSGEYDVLTNRLAGLVAGLLPGNCGCGEVNALHLVDLAVEEALLGAADFFMRRDGATLVVEHLLRMRDEWERSDG